MFKKTLYLETKEKTSRSQSPEILSCISCVVELHIPNRITNITSLILLPLSHAFHAAGLQKKNLMTKTKVITLTDL